MGAPMEKAEAAVYEAGKFLLKKTFEQDLIIKEGTANYATEVDIGVQQFLMPKLQEILPGCNIITEETDRNVYNLDRPTWILDPVDGTINLYHLFRHSAISLALFVEGKPSLGIIYDPFTGEMFTAQQGSGAFLDKKNIHVSRVREMKESLICFGTTPYSREDADVTFKITQDMFMGCQDIRRTGSAALDIAYTACGRIDGFFEMRLQPWDYAAGDLILQEAGGRITSWEGHELSVVHPDSVIASNGGIHLQMMDIIHKNTARHK